MNLSPQLKDCLDRYGIYAVLSVTAVLLLRQIGDSSLGYPDADRILMDGVFIRDFLSDMPISRIGEEFPTDSALH